MNTKEISRTPYGEDQPNATIVQRVRNGKYQVLKEVMNSTGEIVDPENELLTTETIVITRHIGVNQQF